MINRKQAALLICVAFLFGTLLFWQGGAVAQSKTGPGSEADPLVSKSYVDEQISQLQEKVTKLQEEVSSIKGELARLQGTGLPGASRESDSTGKGKQGVVAAETGAIMRSGPGKNFDQVGGVKKGTPVRVLEVRQGWYRIETKTRLSGWVYGKLLSIKDNGD